MLLTFRPVDWPIHQREYWPIGIQHSASSSQQSVVSSQHQHDCPATKPLLATWISVERLEISRYYLPTSDRPMLAKPRSVSDFLLLPSSGWRSEGSSPAASHGSDSGRQSPCCQPSGGSHACGWRTPLRLPLGRIISTPMGEALGSLQQRRARPETAAVSQHR